MFLGLYHQPLGKLDGFVSLCQSCIEAIFRHDAPEKGSSNLCHGRDTLIYWIQIRHSISSTTSLPTALGVVQPSQLMTILEAKSCVISAGWAFRTGSRRARECRGPSPARRSRRNPIDDERGAERGRDASGQEGKRRPTGRGS